MPRAKKSEPAEPKAKTVNVKLIDCDDPIEGEANRESFEILLKYRHTYHRHLKDLSIGLAWRYGWKPDKDNHMILGQCKKRSDLDREFSDYDFVILLNYEVWHAPWFDRSKKEWLVDHELCHAKKVFDKNGEPKLDARGRFVGRSRRGHDIEEFLEIVERHGVKSTNLAKLATIMHAQKDRPLLPAETGPLPSETISEAFNQPLPPDDPLPSEAVQKPLAEEMTVSLSGSDREFVQKVADGLREQGIPAETAEDPFPSTVPLPSKGRGGRRRKAE